MTHLMTRATHLRRPRQQASRREITATARPVRESSRWAALRIFALGISALGIPAMGALCAPPSLARSQVTQPQVTQPQAADPFDESPRRVSGERFDVQMLWFSQLQPEGAARAALSIAEGVGAAEVDGLPAMPATEVRPVLGVAASGKELAELVGGKGGLLSAEPTVAFGERAGESIPSVAVVPRIQEWVMRVTSLTPATARRIAWIAAGQRLELTRSSAGELWDDPVLLAGARAALAHRGLEIATRGRGLTDDPVLASGVHGLIEELGGSGASEEQRGRALRGIAALFAERETPEQTVFNPAAPLAASPGEIACRVLFESNGDAGRALRALGLAPAPDDGPGAPRSPRYTVESGSVGVAGDAFQAVAPRRLDALCLEISGRTGPLVLTADVLVIANDGKSAAQADLVFGEDGAGDRFLLALNERRGPYLFRRPGPEASYEPLAANETIGFPAGRWVPIRFQHDGSAIELFLGDVQLLGYRHKGRSLDGQLGFGAHAGSTAFFRNLKVERGPRAQDAGGVDSGPADAGGAPDDSHSGFSPMRATVLTPTPNFAESLDFYKRAGFARIDDRTNPERAVWTDGAVVVEVDADRFARTALVLYGEETRALAGALADAVPVVERDGAFVLSDPNGVRVWLRPEDPSFPEGADEAPSARLGSFAGLSIEAFDPGATVEFWQRLGYTVKAGGPDKGWTQLGREGAIDVSVMGPFSCPHLFFNPGLTYFNSGKNPEVIAALRTAGVPITEEITVFSKTGDVDNVIVRDPGGTGFFVFND